MPVFVLGNGESRLRYKPEELKKRGSVYGCNAIYRDFAPDILVSIDPHMAREIIESGYAESHTCYFAYNDYGDHLPESCMRGEFGKSVYCGPTALRLAIHFEKPEKIYLVGFDIIDTKWSNVYTATRGYADNRELARRTLLAGQNIVHNPPTVEQLKDIFIEHPDITFCKVMESNQFRYKPWEGVRNIVYLNDKQFRKLLKI